MPAIDLLQPSADTLPALIVILRAAHLAGDGDLEASAREELRERYGVEINFPEENSGDAPLILPRGGRSG
jgi:hypothetical protein